ncbi:MAG TPA: D-arabinono-1,4-lactone oxidase [Longimicrobium sp.]|nr:D-arabinono-1,4-lactone oxidase [Longimicrobium sp.]
MWRNWSGGQRCEPAVIERPSSSEEIARALGRAAAAGQTVRVGGSGHSFTDLVPTDQRLVLLDRMTRVLEVDRERARVKVEAGLPLWALNQTLAEHGLAMPNLGDVDAQTVAGALSTGTHGTGARLPNLAAQVEALELVTASGEVVRCSAGDPDLELFRAARISLGALGILSTVTLRCVPAFTLCAVEAPMPLDEVLSRVDALADGNDHFEFFLFPYARVAMTKANNRTDEPPAPPSKLAWWTQKMLVENHAFGLLTRAGRTFPGWIPAINRTASRFASRTRCVDRSDRIFVTPRRVRFEELEYAVPREAAASAVRGALDAIEQGHHPANFPLEVRFVAPDDAFLSPAYERPTCYIAVHVGQGLPWEPCFRAVEKVMEAHGGRPHWGKRHFQTAETLAPRYPAWQRFQQVRARVDPKGLLTSPALERLLGKVGSQPHHSPARAAQG